MKIIITGGCGYVGSVLVPLLLNHDHKIIVIDTQWFGNHLKPHDNLIIDNCDIRNISQVSLQGIDSVIHLANIANDPSVDLDPLLSWEVNVLGAYLLADRAARDGVKQVIYASSGSVYGVKKEPNVTEDLELMPLSAYNKTKMIAERVLMSFKDKMSIHCIRPATVCGVSPSMRLDVSVNMLTFQGVTKGAITVYGGQQTRPNIHIHDVSRVFQHFLANSDLPSGAYNAGFENLSIDEIAQLVADKTGAAIEHTSTNDPRSYRQDSTKLLATGFEPLFSVKQAVNELVAHFSPPSGFVPSSFSYRVKALSSSFKSL